MKRGIEYWSCESTPYGPEIRVEQILANGRRAGYGYLVSKLELEQANVNLLALKIEYVAREFRRYKAGVLS